MSNLQNVNSETLGVSMPEITLPNGVKIQTGTVGALLVNIRAYNKAHAEDDKDTLAKLKPLMSEAVPLLDNVGLFDLFSPEEWIQGDNEGRKFVGQKVLEFKKAQETSS